MLSKIQNTYKYMVVNAYKTYKRKQNRKYLNINYLVQYRSDYHQTYIILFKLFLGRHQVGKGLFPWHTKCTFTVM